MDFFPSLRSERLGDRVSATGKTQFSHTLAVTCQLACFQYPGMI